MEFDVPIEELVEDFEGESVEISVTKKHQESPDFKRVIWTEMPEVTVEPDYKHASPEAYEKFLDMKFGMFIHFGTYTQIGLLESWSAEFQKAPSSFMDIYYTLYQSFNPTEFNADEWASLAKRAGMQFFQCTTKHHEGFCLYDTKTKTKALRRIGSQARESVYPIEECEINYSVMDTPFKRDIIEELVRAFRKEDLGIGLYFSHFDWNDPNFRWDPSNRNYDPNYGSDTHPEQWKAFIEREREQLHEILTKYGEIDQIFFDGTWYGFAWEEMKSIIKEIRKLQPNCMFSDRGLGPYADFTSPERWIPKKSEDDRLKGRASVWQACDVIGTHWSWVPGEKYKKKEDLLTKLIDSVAKGGTLSLDINPMPNGKFPQETIDILEYMGRWLQINGEAIYFTRKWEVKIQEESTGGKNIYYTSSKDKSTIYAIHFGWPASIVKLTDIIPKFGSEIRMLGVDQPLSWKIEGGFLIIDVLEELNNKIPCEFAYSFKIEVQ